MNVIDLRTTDERMAPLAFDLTPTERAEAKVYQAQLVRQRDDRSAIEACNGPRPDRERWTA